MGKRRKHKGRSQVIGRRRRYRVFLSHATADKWIATTLCEKIEAAGADTFRDDRDIKGGDDIPDEIRRELNCSQELVVLLTPDSVGRPWVLLEVGGFWAKRKNARIVAVHCHVNVDTIPDMIKSKKAMSINEFDSYLAEVAGRIKALTPWFRQSNELTFFFLTASAMRESPVRSDRRSRNRASRQFLTPTYPQAPVHLKRSGGLLSNAMRWSSSCRRRDRCRPV